MYLVDYTLVYASSYKLFIVVYQYTYSHCYTSRPIEMKDPQLQPQFLPYVHYKFSANMYGKPQSILNDCVVISVRIQECSK